jgi:uncharacterized protein (TIGR02266 family)
VARAHPRHRGAIPVKLKLPSWERFETLQTRDMSRGGLFLKTAKPLPRGAAVALTLVAPNGQAIAIAAEVARVVEAGGERPPGMGLRFVDDSDTLQARIGEILRDQFEPPAAKPPPLPPDVPAPPAPEPTAPEPAGATGLPARALLETDLFTSASVAGVEPHTARQLIDTGQYDDAASLLEVAAAVNPDQPLLTAAIHLARGLRAREAGDPDGARGEFEAALSIDPRCLEAIERLRHP